MSTTLIAYFSATGVTQRVATVIAEAVKGDLFRIQPASPYTAPDLDWHDKNSRSSLEMKDNASRPEIADKVEDMDRYRIIFLGFPVWWYEPPRIIATFLESYDFRGKAMIPFMTSGSSGPGRIPELLERLCPDAVWLPCRRFGAGASKEEVANWAREHIDWQSKR